MHLDGARHASQMTPYSLIDNYVLRKCYIVLMTPYSVIDNYEEVLRCTIK